MSSNSIEKIICEGDEKHIMKSPEEFQHMTCKEDARSPINITHINTSKVVLPELSWENWKKKPLKMELFNTGHTLLLAGLWRRNKPMISGGPLTSKYKFLQLHFHWGNKNEEGSFHTFDNEALPLELHAIFLKECYETQEEALKHSDGMIVLVYVYKVHDSGNSSIEVISQLCPLVEEGGNSVFCPPLEIGSLLYPFSHDYFVYWGSIKVNEKGHAMLWLLCRHPFAITTEQLQRFRSLKSNDAKNSAGDRCRVKLPNSRENDLFLVNPRSSLQSTLFEVDPNMKWENFKTKMTFSKDRKNQVGKRKSQGDDCEENITNQFNLNLVGKAVKVVKSLMEKSDEDEIVKSVSLDDISAGLKGDGSVCGSLKSVSRASLASHAKVERLKPTDLGNVAECTQARPNSCEYQAEHSDSGQEVGSEANCSRSRSQLGDEVSDEIWVEPAASSEPESEAQLVCPKPRLLSSKDSVQTLRQNYSRKRRTADSTNTTTTTSSPLNQKATAKPARFDTKTKQNPQKQTVKIQQPSKIPLQITPYKSILKNQNTQPTKQPQTNKQQNLAYDRTRVMQRSSTAPGSFAGKDSKTLSPPSCRPTTPRESERQTNIVKRPGTVKEPLNPCPIRRANTDIKPRWKY
ncbi:hypothetical protein LSTR_LSTR005528 [Laodelphax striatellus]|uniref:Alpha-carbonic anhydrase domain-containing protein n=1 Tax=Laodelphax striatellus TaxID=195883 RepID=A0A482WX43_LAOST|nr:hypothetical protein LSTR_LSTR005528 [Laodelphax striatellus]